MLTFGGVSYGILLVQDWPTVDLDEKMKIGITWTPSMPESMACLMFSLFQTSCLCREKVSATVSICTVSNTFGCGNSGAAN